MIKEIEGYEGKYAISEKGEIFRKRKGKMIEIYGWKHTGGYKAITLCADGSKKHFYVHRLVAETFLLNPEAKRTINHINGIKTDNRAENLEFATYSENHKHAYRIGLKIPPDHRGEKNTKRILNEHQVRLIRHLKLVTPKMKLREVANIFHVSISAIYFIQKGLSWKNVTI